MTLRRFACFCSLALFLALPASAQAGGRVASATGVKQVDGETFYVDVVVAVPVGQSDRQATDKALSEQGASRRAKPPWAGGPGGPNGGGGGGTEQYFYTGLEWSPPSVTQNYNSVNQPLDGATALRNTHSDWSNLPDSAYDIRYGGGTTRCPSLVQECPGAQFNDPYNDVGWLALGGTTLGVTWYTTIRSGDTTIRSGGGHGAQHALHLEEQLRQQQRLAQARPPRASTAPRAILPGCRRYENQLF